MKAFPFANELNKKWWHRLSKVLIFGISSAVFILAVLIARAAILDSRVSHEIYDFEKGYISHTGDVVSVNRYSARYGFIDRMISASNETQSSSDGRARTFSNPMHVDQMKRVFKASDSLELQQNFFKAEPNNYPNFSNLEMKIWYGYSYFPELLFVLIGPVVYFGLICLYGLVLYVVFGNNPFKPNS